MVAALTFIASVLHGDVVVATATEARFLDSDPVVMANFVSVLHKRIKFSSVDLSLISFVLRINLFFILVSVIELIYLAFMSRDDVSNVSPIPLRR